MVDVFRCVRDVLADDGTLWLNLGDSYGKGKQLLGMPWRIAFALQNDGWVLRQDIIWNKPNPMPESVTDRCTKAHEYIFLLSKSQRYFIDQEGMREPAVSTRGPGNIAPPKSAVAYENGDERHRTKSGLHAYAERQRSKRDSFRRENSKREQNIPGQNKGTHRPDRTESNWDLNTRNRRSVWSVSTSPYRGAHFAVFPPDLIRPCILAGAAHGDTVLDPFMGSGTTAEVAILTGRQYLGCELNPEYAELQEQRIKNATETIDLLTAQMELFA